MKRLSDEDLDRCDQTSEFCSEEFWSLLAEVKEHRAAHAVNAERIKEVVEVVVNVEMKKYADESIQEADWTKIRKAIAARASERASEWLAAPAVTLTADEISQLEHHVKNYSVICAASCSIIDRLITAHRGG